MPIDIVWSRIISMREKFNFKRMNKNKKTLESFVEYCDKHPEQRFWQALRNWSGYEAIYSGPVVDLRLEDLKDTFYKVAK